MLQRAQLFLCLSFMRCKIKIQKCLCDHKTNATFLQRVSLVCSIEYRYSPIHSIATFRYPLSLLFGFFLWKIHNFSVSCAHFSFIRWWYPPFNIEKNKIASPKMCQTSWHKKYSCIACDDILNAKHILYYVCFESSERRWWQVTGIFSECLAPITNRPLKVYWAFKGNHRRLASIASQQAYAIIFGFIQIRDLVMVLNLHNKPAVR